MIRHLLTIVYVPLLVGIVARPAPAQEIVSRGFADARLVVYPERAPNDPVRVVGEGLVRYEPSLSAGWLRVAASFDARMDTHDQVERRWTIDWQDRGIRRPQFSVRRLSAMASRGGLNVELGKQFIRWGNADILNPTDRFAPRDYLSVADSEFLGVTGARLMWERAGNTIDLAWLPRFTPSRIPLFDQRWSVVPVSGVPTASLPGLPAGTSLPALLPVVDAGAIYPGGSQQGARFNRSGAGYEFSVAFYNGFNHLPLIVASLEPGPFRIALTRLFPRLRMYGGDAAFPTRWLTLKGEVGYFTYASPEAEEYAIYVLQVERQVGEWLLVGGYAGDVVTRRAAELSTPPRPSPGLPGVAVQAAPFSPDRGLARAFLGRASVALDASRSVAFETAVRQNGKGSWLKGEYSATYGEHVRATILGTWIRGDDTDFIGQYHRNSNLSAHLRYSF